MKQHRMRRTSMILLVCLALFCASTAMAGAAHPQTTARDAFSYTVVDGRACGIRYQGLADDILVPGELDGHPAATLGDGAFMHCFFIDSVTIHEGIVAIGSYAFSGCAAMTVVTVPASVRFIGERAFAGCENLTLVVPANSYAQQYAQANGIPYTTA